MNEGKKIHLKLTEQVNVQKKIEPQLQLYSTKKKTVRKNEISKPSIHEVNTIVTGLDDQNSKCLNIYNTFDHSYL